MRIAFLVGVAKIADSKKQELQLADADGRRCQRQHEDRTVI